MGLRFVRKKHLRARLLPYDSPSRSAQQYHIDEGLLHLSASYSPSISKSVSKMPHHPSEEETESNIFDKVAKQSGDSTASDHPLHEENEEPVKATAEDHKSKGPQISESKPKSRL